MVVFTLYRIVTIDGLVKSGAPSAPELMPQSGRVYVTTQHINDM
jgi:hypothetical protein